MLSQSQFQWRFLSSWKARTSCPSWRRWPPRATTTSGSSGCRPCSQSGSRAKPWWTYSWFCLSGTGFCCFFRPDYPKFPLMQARLCTYLLQISVLLPRICPLYPKFPFSRFPLKQNGLYSVYSKVCNHNGGCLIAEALLLLSRLGNCPFRVDRTARYLNSPCLTHHCGQSKL